MSDILGPLQSQILGLQMQALQQSTLNKVSGQKSQINEISAPSEDDSFEECNKFFSEFKSMMVKDSDDSSA